VSPATPSRRRGRAPAVSFGVFDWLDEGPGELADRYEPRLKLLELADGLPFRCVVPALSAA
jgi:hypothetical protein